MPPQPFPAEHPLLFLALFFGSMLVSAYLVAAMSGWRELARVYPSGGTPPDARLWRGQSGRMRYGTRYNYGLNIAANRHGIELRVLFILRPGHPPLFIPWTDIETQPVQGMFSDSVRFSFRRASPWIIFRRTLAEELLQARGDAAFPVQRGPMRRTVDR